MKKTLYGFWIVLGVIIFAGLARTAEAQTDSEKLPVSLPGGPLRFQTISIEEGLSQSVVLVTFQDRQGFLWFGTQDGLNRYDGRSFTVFRPDPDDPHSISDRYITSIVEDRNGNLWLGTLIGGVNRYDPLTGKFTRFMHDPADPASLPDNCIRSIALDAQGMLWIATVAGIDVLDPQKQSFITAYRNDPANPASLAEGGVTVLFFDSQGALWAGSENGLQRLNPDAQTFTHYQNDPENSDSLLQNHVTRLAEDADGGLWVGTQAGLDRMDRKTQVFTHYKHDPETPGSLGQGEINALWVDHTQTLWAGTSFGLNRFDAAAQSFRHYGPILGDPDSLKNPVILSLYEDREHILWIGTYGDGVSKLDPGKNKFPLIQYDSADPKAISAFQMIEDQQGDLWFAMYGHGLLRLNPKTGDFTHYKHNPEDKNSLPDDFVFTVSQSRDGMLWVGSGRGVTAFDPKSGQFTRYQRDETNPDSFGAHSGGFTFEDRAGALWIATAEGLERLDRATGQFIHYDYDPATPAGLSHPHVGYLYETQNGEFWLGMFEAGISRLDRATGQFTHFRHDPDDPASLSSDNVLSITQDRAGRLWVATSGGLNQFLPESGTFDHYTTKDGLPNDMVYGALEDDDGFLWLSTNQGLSRFDPQSRQFTNYDRNDGLQSNEFNSYSFTKTRAGELLFGGIAGVNLFRPSQLSSNSYVPPITLTRFTQGGQPIQPGTPAERLTEVTLRWPHNYFEFEFAALSFSDPEKNQYRYKLERFDQEWGAASSLTAGRYTNLPGGNYTLRVIGSNNDGVWNENGISLKIKVIPPLWDTWWFRGSIGVIAILGVFTTYRLRVRTIKTYNQQLERQVEARTREIEQLFEQTKELAVVEERNRLARDLHDSAKQKAFAALAQLGATRATIQRDLSTARNHLDEAENLVHEVIQELTFLIQEMYPVDLAEKGLAAVLREYVYELKNRTDIHPVLEIANERRLPVKTEQALYRIAQESLANVARHSHASQVSVRLYYADSQVRMEISDNGNGFDLAKKPSGVGLRSMRERAATIGGQLEIRSNPGGGTNIYLQAPAPSNPEEHSPSIGG